MQHHFLATAVADAVARRDPQPLSTLLTETVRLRALLPGGLVESHGRADAVACFVGWFVDFDAVEVVEAAGEAVADRVLIHYRLGLSRAAPSHATQRWVCTQTAIGKVVDGRLAVIDLLCSGFREIENLRGDREPSGRSRTFGEIENDDGYVSAPRGATHVRGADAASRGLLGGPSSLVG